jgi:hypothetical protein
MAVMLFSCDSEEKEHFVIESSVTISVKDKDGLDLLNPDNENSIDRNLIRIYYEVGGEKIEVYEPHLDHSKGFYVEKQGGEYQIIIFTNLSQREEYPLTYIEWNPDDTDTIQCLIERTSNTEICKKVWYNGKIVWDDYGTERFFEIVK